MIRLPNNPWLSKDLQVSLQHIIDQANEEITKLHRRIKELEERVSTPIFKID